jgi:hypothetical protein
MGPRGPSPRSCQRRASFERRAGCGGMAHEKGAQGEPPRAQFDNLAVRRRLHRGSRSGRRSGTSSGSSSRRSRVSSRGSARGSRSGARSSRISDRSRAISSRSGRIGRRRISGLVASRKSQDSAGNGSGENDLAHVWYSLNSEWTTRDTRPCGKATARVDFTRQLITLAP